MHPVLKFAKLNEPVIKKRKYRSLPKKSLPAANSQSMESNPNEGHSKNVFQTIDSSGQKTLAKNSIRKTVYSSAKSTNATVSVAQADQNQTSASNFDCSIYGTVTNQRHSLPCSYETSLQMQSSPYGHIQTQKQP